MAVEHYLQSEKLPYTVFQPLYIYGPHTAKDCEQWFLDRILRDRIVPIPAPGNQLVALSHVEDVASMLAKVTTPVRIIHLPFVSPSSHALFQLHPRTQHPLSHATRYGVDPSFWEVRQPRDDTMPAFKPCTHRQHMLTFHSSALLILGVPCKPPVPINPHSSMLPASPLRLPAMATLLPSPS